MDKNLYILTGSNYYDIDIFLDELKSEKTQANIAAAG